jgi:hypothetical protein
MKKCITARHAENWHTTKDNPGLTPRGVWQGLHIGFLARRAGMQNVTFFSSPVKRCVQTARIAQLFFPETWFQPDRFRVDPLLEVSVRDGVTITDERQTVIEELVSGCYGDAFISTHSQVLTKKRPGYKVDPGGAYLEKANIITLLCGTERVLETR